MNRIKEIKLDQTNWLEITWVNEEEVDIHCESFGDSDEYQSLVRQRCLEFGTPVTQELEDKFQEQSDNRYVPTPEEIEEAKKEEAKQLLYNEYIEKKTFLDNTDKEYIKFLERGKPVSEDLTKTRLEYIEFCGAYERGELNGE